MPNAGGFSKISITLHQCFKAKISEKHEVPNKIKSLPIGDIVMRGGQAPNYINIFYLS